MDSSQLSEIFNDINLLNKEIKKQIVLSKSNVEAEIDLAATEEVTIEDMFDLFNGVKENNNIILHLDKRKELKKQLNCVTAQRDLVRTLL